MKIAKPQLIQVLRTEGDHDTADRVESQLPDEIDTQRDADALSGVGLDEGQLLAKLAGGSFGTSLSP